MRPSDEVLKRLYNQLPETRNLMIEHLASLPRAMSRVRGREMRHLEDELFSAAQLGLVLACQALIGKKERGESDAETCKLFIVRYIACEMSNCVRVYQNRSEATVGEAAAMMGTGKNHSEDVTEVWEDVCVGLTSEERYILRQAAGGVPLKQVGVEVGLSEIRIKQILAGVRERIRGRIEV